MASLSRGSVGALAPGGANSRGRVTIATAALLITLYVVLRAFTAAFLLSDNTPTIIDELTAAVLAPFALVALVRWLGTFLSLLISLLLYVAFTLLSTAVNSYGGVPQPAAAGLDLLLDLKFFVVFLGFYFLLKKGDADGAIIRHVTKLLLLIALINSVFVLRDLLIGGGRSIHGSPLVPRLGTYQPMGFWHHQFDSALCVMFGLYSAVYLWLKQHRRKHLFYSMFLLVILVAHLSTKEVVSFLVAIGLLVVWPASKKAKNVGLRTAILVLSAVLLVASPVGNLVESQIDVYIGAGRDQQARTALTVTSVEIATNHFPLGSGGGSYASPPSYQMGYSGVYSAYGLSGVWGLSREKSNFITDVFWPKILAQSGVLGLIVFFIAIFGLFVPVVWNYVSKRGPENWFSLAMVVSSLAASTSSTPYSNEQYYVVLAFSVAYAWATSIAPPREARR